MAVKGLQVGDTLEYHAQTEITKPLIAGQFWYTHEFVHGVVVLQEELEIGVPRERYVKVKSPDVQPATRDEGGTRIYSLQNSQPRADHRSERRGCRRRQQSPRRTANDLPYLGRGWAMVQVLGRSPGGGDAGDSGQGGGSDCPPRRTTTRSARSTISSR